MEQTVISQKEGGWKSGEMGRDQANTSNICIYAQPMDTYNSVTKAWGNGGGQCTVQVWDRTDLWG